jgi:Rieske Fe-S protein
MISRRVFIKGSGAAVVCACAVGATGCGSRPTSDTPVAAEGSYRIEDDLIVFDLSRLDALRPVGGAVKLTVQSGTGSELKLVVVHSTDDDYRAFTDCCTHNSKELNYLHEDGKLACCGLGSEFDLAGNVLEGPAEDALARHAVRLEGDELVVEM